MHIITAGNPFDGMSFYGPFEDIHAAIHWADCNPVTDLTGESWHAVAVREPKTVCLGYDNCEIREDGGNAIVIVGELYSGLIAYGPFTDVDVAKEFRDKFIAQMKEIEIKPDMFSVTVLDRIVEESVTWQLNKAANRK